MRIIDRVDGNVYLRCWGDYYNYSVVVTRPGSLARPDGVAHHSRRLEAAAKRVEATGVQGEWFDGGHGYGRAYRFTGPWGHPMSLLWDVEQVVTEPGSASIYPDRPNRRSKVAGAPRLLDHVTIATSDVEASPPGTTRCSASASWPTSTSTRRPSRCSRC